MFGEIEKYKNELVDEIKTVSESLQETNELLQELQIETSSDDYNNYIKSEYITTDDTVIVDYDNLDNLDNLFELLEYTNEKLDLIIETIQRISIATDTILPYAYIFVPLVVIVLSLWWFFRQFLERYI